MVFKAESFPDNSLILPQTHQGRSASRYLILALLIAILLHKGILTYICILVARIVTNKYNLTSKW